MPIFGVFRFPSSLHWAPLARALILLLTVFCNTASKASEMTPGLTLQEVFDDPDLSEVLWAASNPIISPDGKHLYLHRSQIHGEEGMISVFVLSEDESHSPSFVRSYASSCCDPNALEGPNLTITAFNSMGTIAYARYGRFPPSAHQFGSWGVAVLSRDPTTGDLSELQRINMPELTFVSAGPTVTADDRYLYVSYRGINRDFQGVPELRTYELQPTTGLLGSLAASVSLDPEDPLTGLKLIEDDTRLLAGTDNALVEYQRNTSTGGLSELRTSALPALPRTIEGEPRDSGPVAIAVTRNGLSVYTLRQLFIGFNGGFLNTFSRNPTTGELTLVSEFTPDDFPDGGLYAGTQLLLNQAEDVLIATSRYSRFFAGSPSDSGCFNTFARDISSGQLSPAGYQCDPFVIGFSWATFPGEDLYYTNASRLRPTIAGSSDTFPTQLAVWGPGLIGQPTNIHAAILPTSRSLGDFGTHEEPVTYFTSVLNPGSSDALQCSVDYAGPLPLSVRFQVNDPATNEPLNPDQFDREFEIPAGGVTQLLLTIDAFSEFSTSNIGLDYSCVNTPKAPTVQGVTTVLLSSSALPLPDLITGTATLGNTGITRLTSTEGSGFFTVSTINIGAAAEVRAVPVFDLAELIDGLTASHSMLDATLRICETNPATGECLAPPTEETSRNIGTQEVATYTVFVQGEGSDIAFDPGNNRVFIAFVDASGEVRGASSVAITTD